MYLSLRLNHQARVQAVGLKGQELTKEIELMIPTLTINDELMTFSDFFFAFEGVVWFIIQKYAFQSKNFHMAICSQPK
jgi:hypothetical protein